MKWLCVAHEKEIPDFSELAKNGWRTHAVGIGQFHSLLHFTELLAGEKPEAVLLAGTCGSLDKADLLRICFCSHFAFPFVANEEVPEFLEQNFATYSVVETGALLPATVLQNYGVSLDAGKFIANTQKIPADFPRRVVENMEAASLALACKRLSIPFSAMLCVTNEIGPTARAEWKQNFRAAGDKLAHALSSVVTGFSPLPGD